MCVEILNIQCTNGCFYFTNNLESVLAKTNLIQ